MVLRMVLILMIATPTASTVGQAIDGSKSVQKKIERLLSTQWPGQKLNIRRITFNEGQHETCPVIAILSSGDSITGYLYIGQCRSKYNRFEYALCLDQEGRLKSSVVLTYREDYGSEVCSKSWLGQFINKDTGDAWVYGADITAISGATISGTHLSNSIHRAVIFVQQQLASGGLQ